MKNLTYRFQRWFDINLGWFFINGRKQEKWFDYLREKYENKK